MLQKLDNWINFHSDKKLEILWSRIKVCKLFAFCFKWVR